MFVSAWPEGLTLLFRHSTEERRRKAKEDLYGFSNSWASKWFNRLERLSTMNHVQVDSTNSVSTSTINSFSHFTSHREQDIDAPA